MTKIKSIYILLILFSFSFIAKGSESIVWLTDTRRITDDFYSEKNSSLGVETTRSLLKKLNLKNMTMQFANLPKIKKLMAEKSTTTYCVAGRIKNSERELTQIFSQPSFLYPNLKIYYHENKQRFTPEFLNNEGKLISLPSFFHQNSEHILTIEKDRSYGLFLDQQIALIPRKNLNIRTLDRSSKSIVTMLIRDKIKYALLFPTYIKEELARIKEHGYTLNSLDIEGTPPYIFSRIACSKTALGKKIISNINTILNQMYLNEYFYNIHLKYLPKNDHLQFKKDLTKLINDKALI